VTSSQPVTTPNALVFTPDNKHCYAYSGKIQIQTSNTDILNFQTNTEYILAKFNMSSTGGSGNNIDITISFNDIAVIELECSNDFQTNIGFGQYLELIIPPFTEVKVYAAVATSAKDWYFAMTGSAVGMTKTGYQ